MPGVRGESPGPDGGRDVPAVSGQPPGWETGTSRGTSLLSQHTNDNGKQAPHAEEGRFKYGKGENLNSPCGTGLRLEVLA